jgi:hypothetical protein
VTSSLVDLETRLAAVEQRLAILEGGADEVDDSDREAAAPTLGDGFAANASTHVGRVLLIFGGAYLLRAITDFQFVPTAVGVFMGATYAVFWLFMAYRRGGIESQRTNAAFFGGTSVVLTLPLLHEATAKFELLSGVEGIVALFIYCALAMAVAVVRNQKVLAWMVTAGGIATATASLVASQTAVSVAAFLLFLGVASLWVEYRRQWMGLRWLGAIGANLGVLALVGLARSESWSIDPRLPFVFAVVLLAIYLSSFTYHSHVRDQLLGVFETVQTLIAGGIVFGSASMAVQGGQLGTATAGMLSMLLGVGGYALAVARGTREQRYRNFFYYSTFGLVFVVAGTGLLLPIIWAAVVWAIMAVVMAWFSGRTGWVSLSLQCTFLLLAAGIGSGLLATALEALVGDPANGWVVLTYSHIGVAVATVACLFIPVAQESERWGVLAGLPQLIVLALSVWEVGGLIVAFGSLVIAGANGTGLNLAALAALRTAVLSAASVTLALSSRHWRWPEARWLVYPVLVLVGIKLFVEDFPNGQPASLFVALAFVGSALLLVARLLKSTPGSDSAS